MSIKKTKNGTYHLKVYIPNEVQPKLGLGAYYEKRFKTSIEKDKPQQQINLQHLLQFSRPKICFGFISYHFLVNIQLATLMKISS